VLGDGGPVRQVPTLKMTSACHFFATIAALILLVPGRAEELGKNLLF
jgi:hypothetical protein